MKYEESPEAELTPGKFVLDSGREIESYGSELTADNVDGEIYVFHGYQKLQRVLPADLTDAERAEIADYAIDLWRQWRHQK